MSDRRLSFQETLCTVLDCPTSGSDCRVYFQAPSTGMTYPAIIYEMDDAELIHADDILYASTRRYSVILIDKDPDSSFVEKLLNLRYCSFGRHYKADNLHHYTFTIYY